MTLNDGDKKWIDDKLTKLKNDLEVSAPINPFLDLKFSFQKNNKLPPPKNKSLLTSIRNPITAIKNTIKNNEQASNKNNYLQIKDYKAINKASFNTFSGGLNKNYIMAKEAVFNGGQNTVIINNTLTGSSSSYEQREEKKKQNIYQKLVSNSLLSIKKSSKDLVKMLDKFHILTLLKFGLVVAGIAGIVKLVQEIKEKGLGGVVKEVLDGVGSIITKIHLNEKGVQAAGENTVNFRQHFAGPNLNGISDFANVDTESLGNLKDFRTTNTNLTPDDNHTQSDILNKLTKEGVLDKEVLNFSKNANPQFSTTKAKDSQLNYHKVKKLEGNNSSKFSLPVDVIIKSVKYIKGYGLGIKIVNVANPSNRKYLLVIGLTKLYVYWNKKIPKDTLIGILGPKGFIIGDINAFLTDESFEDRQVRMSYNDYDVVNLQQFITDNQVDYEQKYKHMQEVVSEGLENELRRQQFIDNPVVFSKRVFDELKNSGSATLGMQQFDGGSNVGKALNNANNNKQNNNSQQASIQATTNTVSQANSSSSNPINFIDPYLDNGPMMSSRTQL